MTNKLPVTLLAHIDDVFVFQTAAFSSDSAVKSNGLNSKKNQTEHQVEANYGELNLGLHVNDDAASVLNNRMRLLAAINEQVADVSSKSEQCTNIKSLHWVSQVHGKNIYDVDTGALSMKPMLADAMISQQQGLGLAIMTADCVPIVLYQPASGKIAAIHAGWQGLACGIIQATVQHFTEAGQIKAWIGVCISQTNYEVGHQVRDQLLAGCIENQSLTESAIEKFNQLYVINTDTRADKKSDVEKIKINLPKLAADQLSTASVTIDNGLPEHCSYGDSGYYSYRRQTHLQQPATGRMALVIVRSLSAF